MAGSNQRARHWSRLTGPLAVWRILAGFAIGALACLAIVIAVPHDARDVLIPGELMLLTVVVATVVGGRIAGAVLLAASAVALFYYFIPQPESFTGREASDYLAVATYLLVGAVLIVAVVSVIAVRDRLRRERARLGSLVQVSREFGTALDPDAALQEIARAVVPTLCDVCVIDVLEEDGELRRAAAVTSNPGLALLVDELRRNAPDARNLAHPAVAAIRDCEPVFLERITRELLGAALDVSRQRRTAALLLGRSAIIVPIVTDGKGAGAISLVELGSSGVSLQHEDIPIALELAARAGQALERSRAHEEMRHEFVDMQRALLPGRLPTTPGVTVGALYIPAHAASLVGGDWYAAVPIDDARLALAIGDAAGSGLPATAQMARVRYAVLALARREVEPADVLRDLNDYLFAIGQDSFVTVTYGVLDTDRRTWTEARAGHLPTIVRPPDGGATFLEPTTRAGGVPLGVVRDAEYESREHALLEGSTVLLYTDGVFERRGEHLDVGLERLRRSFEAAGAKEPEDACARIVADVAVFPEDDLALLMARIREPGTS